MTKPSPPTRSERLRSRKKTSKRKQAKAAIAIQLQKKSQNWQQRLIEEQVEGLPLPK